MVVQRRKISLGNSNVSTGSLFCCASATIAERFNESQSSTNNISSCPTDARPLLENVQHSLLLLQQVSKKKNNSISITADLLLN